MNKITTEVRYKEASFKFVKEVNNLKLYISTDQTFCVICNQEGDVLFEIKAECGQNVGYLFEASGEKYAWS